ncbi:hypothetical protein K3G39_13360 [Pontibacter sp. HSC-14F20]|uniref:hypothetical protein n=1 Tax=Pontibacter sp. HSC-14F20 TaxID=2864136 RepID=UPI001C72ACAB|nr:hypothetical protein [Pontibacter sp. HSC-14F20]MBX0334225.1 hypothetical protein [Pontibacter sp. HSC-14F20]
MEDQINRDMAAFEQVCEVNELDPQAIEEEAQSRFPDKFRTGKDPERLIWSALDFRAKALISQVVQETNHDAEQLTDKVYTIDGDPAAPAFVINEDAIRSQYSPDKAAEIIDVLGQVKLPITG